MNKYHCAYCHAMITKTDRFGYKGKHTWWCRIRKWLTSTEYIRVVETDVLYE